MARKPRTVHVLFPTPPLFRWFKANLRNAAVETPNGYQVLDESRFAELLKAAEGKEVK